ncbi:MAG: VOC family protein [Syntrophobacteraceae bacterium]
MAGSKNPIPEGYHAVTPYLVVRGASDAIEYYKKAFGATERFRMMSPDGKSVMHAELSIGDSIIFLSDEFPEMESKSPMSLHGSPVTIHLYVEDVDEVFNRAVSEGGTVTKPLENMFWGDRFGELKDPFGHRWSLATHVEDVPPEELERRGAEAFGQCAGT